MAHFAHVVDGVVTQVIVAETAVIAARAGTWVQTSYNTSGGIHDGGGTPLRYNYAGIGYTYDTARDAFIAPQPFASWVLDEATCRWGAPVAMPSEGGPWAWDEDTESWVAV